jgi:hypothetical protein
MLPSLTRRFSLPTLSPASTFSLSASFPNLTVSLLVLFYGCELIKPPKKWKLTPKTISSKMAELMPPQNW